MEKELDFLEEFDTESFGGLFEEDEGEDTTPAGESEDGETKDGAEGAEGDTTPAEEPEETEGEENAETETKDDAKGDTTPAERITFKFNHEERELPAKAAKDIAEAMGMDAPTLISTLQKGANYDRLNEKLNASPAAKAVKDISESMGLSEEDAVKTITDLADRLLLIEAVNAEKAAHPEADEETVTELAKRKIALERADRVKAARQSDADRQKAEFEPWKRLFERYPDIKDPVKDIPDSVKQAVADGATPIEAYQDYLLKKQSADLMAERKKQEVKKKSPGSVKAGIGESGEDPFMAAFYQNFE